MKKLICVLLALALCLSMALADEFEESASTGALMAQAPEPEPIQPQEPPAEPQGDPDPDDPQDSPDADGEPDSDGEAGGDEPEAGESCEGYVEDGGQRRTGTLEALLADAGAKTVYVSAKEPVRIENFLLALLRDVKLLPDPSVYGEKYAVVLTSESGAVAQEDIDAATDETILLTVSVVKEEPDPGEKEEPGEDERVVLKVTPSNFTDGIWNCEIPGFLLEGIPEGAAGYGYAAIIYDERIVPLSGDEFFAQEEGEYAVRFAIVDALGDIVSKSDRYALKLDFTPPELTIDVSAERDYTMTLSATDSLSGVIELSLDGGETWVPLGEGESVVHTESRRKVFAPGMIQVRDLAGNVSANPGEIVLDAIPKMSIGGWGGGGGGSTPAAPHASGDGDTSSYSSYELALPEGAVDVLTLGGEEIDLGLEIEGEEKALFTAELTAWATEKTLDSREDAPKNTLVIRAEIEDAESPCVCVWRVNGAVLRKLYNTDIAYLALQAGDALLSLPTVGFTAGTRYAELKMEGVSTSAFEYEIVMRIDPNAEGPAPAEDGWNMVLGCEAEIHVEVAGERFELIDRVTTPEMYAFDVYCGPTDMPEYPYGEYPRAEVEVR